MLLYSVGTVLMLFSTVYNPSATVYSRRESGREVAVLLPVELEEASAYPRPLGGGGKSERRSQLDKPLSLF